MAQEAEQTCKVPKFTSIEEEAAFWDSHDSTEFEDEFDPVAIQVAHLGRNYFAREGGPQPERARASWRYSEWLRHEAGRLGVPTIAPRPRDPQVPSQGENDGAPR